MAASAEPNRSSSDGTDRSERRATSAHRSSPVIAASCPRNRATPGKPVAGLAPSGRTRHDRSCSRPTQLTRSPSSCASASRPPATARAAASNRSGSGRSAAGRLPGRGRGEWAPRSPRVAKDARITHSCVRRSASPSASTLRRTRSRPVSPSASGTRTPCAVRMSREVGVVVNSGTSPAQRSATSWPTSRSRAGSASEDHRWPKTRSRSSASRSTSGWVDSSSRRTYSEVSRTITLTTSVANASSGPPGASRSARWVSTAS